MGKEDMMQQSRILATAERTPLKSTLSAFVVERNNEQSTEFCDPSARLWRRKYRAEHPTEIFALKCMDGRLNLAVMTDTPPGIIQPFRNVGGKFDLGWPFFGELMREGVEYAMDHGKSCLIFVTYHFSKGDTHRGCKGFGYDTEGARRSAVELQKQFKRVYGEKTGVVYPLVVGIETDEESLIFHGEFGDVYVVADHRNDDEESVSTALAALLPSLPRHMLKDLVPLVIGNQKRVLEVARANRPPIELDHREQIIAVGRGFDWLHLPNRALIVGPYDHDWPSAVATAGSIVLDNIRSKRVTPSEGALLLVSSLSREERGSHGWNTAVEKAKYLERVARLSLEKNVPELTQHLEVLSGVLEAGTRKFYPLP